MKKDNEKIESDHNETESDRRKIIKGALLGGAVTGAAGQLPTSWTKPITDQVMLPAHGATTGLQFDARICAGIDGTWSSNNLTLDTDLVGDGTPCIRFASGDTSGDVLHSGNNVTEPGPSIHHVRIGLPGSLGDSRTATINLSGNLRDSDADRTFDFTLDADATDQSFNFDYPADNDAGDGDLEVNVEIPGFQTARLRVDFNEP